MEARSTRPAGALTLFPDAVTVFPLGRPGPRRTGRVPGNAPYNLFQKPRGVVKRSDHFGDGPCDPEAAEGGKQMVLVAPDILNEVRQLPWYFLAIGLAVGLLLWLFG